MNQTLPRPQSDLSQNARLCEIQINHTRNKKQDHTMLLDQATKSFDYAAAKDAYWNPEEFSLLYGTPLWDESDDTQRLKAESALLGCLLQSDYFDRNCYYLL